MFALNLFLSHFISDYAFSNVYSEKFLSRENYYKHLIWVVLVFLGISYDFVLSGTFILILLGIGLHVLSDFYRMKKGRHYNLLEYNKSTNSLSNLNNYLYVL